MKTYKIFYTEVRGGERTYTKTVTCKRPASTKAYQAVKAKFARRECFSYGFETSSL